MSEKNLNQLKVPRKERNAGNLMILLKLCNCENHRGLDTFKWIISDYFQVNLLSMSF